MRVPVPDGSLTDITCVLTDYPSVEQINTAFKLAADNDLKGILEYSEDPLVSSAPSMPPVMVELFSRSAF